MIVFAWNMLLAVAWAALVGDFSAPSLLVGFILAYAALALVFRRHPDFRHYFARLPKFASFVIFFIIDLVKSNLRVAYDVVTPRHLMRPGVLAIPLSVTTDREITILANLISVTPGTLSLDVSSDRRVLYIHAMYIDDEDELRRDISDLERRVHEVFG